MFDLPQHAIITGEKLGVRFVEARTDDLSIREIKTEMEEVKDVKTMRRIGVGETYTTKVQPVIPLQQDCRKRL